MPATATGELAALWSVVEEQVIDFPDRSGPR